MASAQNEPNASFLLGLYSQKLDPVRAEAYFQRAKSAAWSLPEGTLSTLAALNVSEHFQKWHYLNFHQRISDGFSDGGRQRSTSNRERLVVEESDTNLQRCVSQAQNILKPIPGAPPIHTSDFSRCFDVSRRYCLFLLGERSGRPQSAWNRTVNARSSSVWWQHRRPEAL